MEMAGMPNCKRSRRELPTRSRPAIVATALTRTITIPRSADRLRALIRLRGAKREERIFGYGGPVHL